MSKEPSEQEAFEFYNKNVIAIKDLDSSDIGIHYTITSIQRMLSGKPPTKCKWTSQGPYIAGIPLEERPGRCHFAQYMDGKKVVEFYTNSDLKCMYNKNDELIDERLDMLKPRIDVGRGFRKLHPIELAAQSLYEIAFKTVNCRQPPDWFKGMEL